MFETYKKGKKNHNQDVYQQENSSARGTEKEILMTIRIQLIKEIWDSKMPPKGPSFAWKLVWKRFLMIDHCMSLLSVLGLQLNLLPMLIKREQVPSCESRHQILTLK